MRGLQFAAFIAAAFALVMIIHFVSSTVGCNPLKQELLTAAPSILPSPGPCVAEIVKVVAETPAPSPCPEGLDIQPLVNENKRLKSSVARLLFALNRAQKLTPHEKVGMQVTQSPTCDLPFKNPPTKPRVAISLIVIHKDDFLKECIPSLLASDIMQEADVALFVWYNMAGSNAYKYMHQVKGIPVIEVPNPPGNNSGIVIPRIRIMEAMMAHGCNFQWFLEMHDDMYFFPTWFQPLIQRDRPQYGILMPFIVDGIATVPVVKEIVDRFSANLTEDVNIVYERCVQVHPWLLKRELIEDIGYYNPIFSPHIAEDDDFYLRVIRAGWLPVAIRTSWVLHRGGLTRGMFLSPDNGNFGKFHALHGVDLGGFKNTLLHGCHAAVSPATGPRFPPAAAPPRMYPG